MRPRVTVQSWPIQLSCVVRPAAVEAPPSKHTATATRHEDFRRVRGCILKARPALQRGRTQAARAASHVLLPARRAPPASMRHVLAAPSLRGDRRASRGNHTRHVDERACLGNARRSRLWVAPSASVVCRVRKACVCCTQLDKALETDQLQATLLLRACLPLTKYGQAYAHCRSRMLDGWSADGTSRLRWSDARSCFAQRSL